MKRRREAEVPRGTVDGAEAGRRPTNSPQDPGRSGGLRFQLEGFCEHGFLLDRSPSDCPYCDRKPRDRPKPIHAELVEVIAIYRDGHQVSLRLDPMDKSWKRSTLSAEPRSGPLSPSRSA